MKCQAFIDLKTGIALEGEAFLNASRTTGTVCCGYELEPGDMFCPSCGAPTENYVPRNCKTKNKKRATRLNLWCSAVIFTMINLLWFILFSENYNAIDGSLEYGLLLKILGYANLFAFTYFIQISVRRLHDIGCSGWLIAPCVILTIIASFLTIGFILIEDVDVAVRVLPVWITIIDWLVTLVNLGMIIWLGLAKGSKVLNKYGFEALMDGNVKFTARFGFVGFVIVILVIGGLEMFILPYCAEQRELARNNFQLRQKREREMWWR